MKYNFIILLSYICIVQILSAAIPIDLNLNEFEKTEFAIKLPNNDLVSIKLNFKLMKWDQYEDQPWSGVEELETINTTQSPTSSTKKNFTVQQAIEAFRQDLVQKEKNIAGIIESKQPFYRHFQLQYIDDIMLRIRCTYDATYTKRSLNISCFEYRQVELERILSNGEIETVTEDDTTLRSNVTLINIQNYKQTFNMEIS